MAKSYQKKPLKPKQTHRSKVFLPVVLSFLLGYLSASLFNFHELTAFVSQHALVKHETQKTSRNTAKPHKPKFEFYNTLAADNAESKNVPVIDAKPAAIADTNSSYYLQVASFKNKNEADSFKASLILKGYDASISSIISTTSTWYRVNAGPFSSIQSAEKTQAAIAKSEKIMAIIRKVDG